jgi:hypothetical protein
MKTRLELRRLSKMERAPGFHRKQRSYGDAGDVEARSTRGRVRWRWEGEGGRKIVASCRSEGAGGSLIVFTKFVWFVANAARSQSGFAGVGRRSLFGNQWSGGSGDRIKVDRAGTISVGVNGGW